MAVKLCCVIFLIAIIQFRPVQSFTRIDPVARWRASKELYEADLHKRDAEKGLPTPGQILGLKKGEELQKVTSVRTKDGLIKTKMQETYKGLNIIGETVVIGQKSDGRYTGDVSGKLVEGIYNDVPSVTPKLSVSDALNIAVKNEGDNMKDVIFDANLNSKLEITVKEVTRDKFSLQTVKLKDSKKAKLVYVLSYRVERKGELSRPYYLIDANTGQIVDKWQAFEGQSTCGRLNLESRYVSVGGNLKTGLRKYDGKDLAKLKISRAGDTCIFENYAVRVINMQSNWTVARSGYNSTFEFDCNEGFNDTINGGYSPLSDVLFHATAVYDMYKKWYKTTPLKFQIVARVHFGSKMNNAFWNGRYITFGDGFRYFHPLVSLDVVAHEIGHGIVGQNSGLIYRGQSGGMNEAFADISGEAAEYFTYGKNDWLVGGELKINGTALRYFVDPTKDGRSIAHASELLKCGPINVHYSSGVFNRAFYTLSRKPGWSVKKAYDVMVLANKLYWRRDSDFGDGACGAVKAAVDLGYIVQHVRDAFVSAGVAPCQSDLLLYSDLQGNKNKPIVLTWQIPPYTGSLEIRTTQGKGNVDLYIRRGSLPTASSCDHKSTGPGNEEKIVKENPSPGTYYILLSSPTSFSGVGLIAKYKPKVNNNNNNNIVENLDSCGIRNYRKWLRFSFNIPHNVSSLIFQGKTESGHVHMVIRHGGRVSVGKGNWKFDKIFNFGTKLKTYRLCEAKAGEYHVLMGAKSPYNGTTVSYFEMNFPEMTKRSLSLLNLKPVTI